MLTRPDITDGEVAEVLRGAFGVELAEARFMPLGWVENAVFRIDARGGARFFLKLRPGDAGQAALAIPAFLRAQGIARVMAPIPTAAGALSAAARGFGWVLYPFFDGRTAFESPLARAQWAALGETMRAVHAARPPAELLAGTPSASYGPEFRDRVRALAERARGRFADPTAARMAELWRARGAEIALVVGRAEELAAPAAARPAEPVVCHADLHAGNVLVGEGGEIAVVDWDDMLVAPKERDLMFVGGGVGGAWNEEREAAWFYEGYGPADIDITLLCYFRYARILVDVAEASEQVFGEVGDAAEREKRLRLDEQFWPGGVVEVAHRTYARLSRRPEGGGTR